MTVAGETQEPPSAWRTCKRMMRKKITLLTHHALRITFSRPLFHRNDLLRAVHLDVAVAEVVVPFVEVPGREEQAGCALGDHEVLVVAVAVQPVADEEDLLELWLERLEVAARVAA